ncbi:HD domain-containing protein [Bacillus tianshenii]|uniref:HD domain-containing protein n=1 Tax=Sutcliffiella tianshenii TaxID=1463404 RepID=UPI001CD5AB65|nr:HD domain-containing protein [Bacillus tianshenii]MCA1319518.1 HD domain-containing protein [Bacillus tianshenii]
MDKIDKALKVAAKAHQGQVRKGTSIPYIVHPVRVGMILQEYGCSEDVICAGILHDTVEDTEVTLSDISILFNENVARLVEGCSEPVKEAPWEERKEHTLKYIMTVDKETGYVICADKMHNLQSIIEDKKESGDAIWSRFNRGADLQEWYYRGILASFAKNENMQETNILQTLIETVHELFPEEES